MTSWKLLESLLAEAKTAKDHADDLFRYVTRRHGEHAADKLRDRMQGGSAPDFKRYVASHFMDPQMDSMVSGMNGEAQDAHPEKFKKDGRGRPKGSTNKPKVKVYGDESPSRDKGSGDYEEIPARPDRAGVTWKTDSKPRPKLDPRSKDFQAVGTAGQNRPQPQPTVAAGVRAADEPAKPNVSGVADAQRHVDHIFSQYGHTDRGRRHADAEALRLGVPTTAQRTRTHDKHGQAIKDPRPSIWSAEKIARAAGPETTTMDDPSDTWADPLTKQRGTKGADHPMAQSRTDKIRAHNLRGKDTLHTPQEPGTFAGQEYQPHGMSKKVPTARPDKSTGNFAYGSTDSDPAKTGKKAVWDPEAETDGGKGAYISKSKYLAAVAQRQAASGIKPSVGVGADARASQNADVAKQRAAENERRKQLRAVAQRRLDQQRSQANYQTDDDDDEDLEGPGWRKLPPSEDDVVHRSEPTGNRHRGGSF